MRPRTHLTDDRLAAGAHEAFRGARSDRHSDSAGQCDYQRPTRSRRTVRRQARSGCRASRTSGWTKGRKFCGYMPQLRSTKGRTVVARQTSTVHPKEREVRSTHHRMAKTKAGAKQPLLEPTASLVHQMRQGPPNAPEFSRGAECELIHQTAWDRRRLQLLVRPRATKAPNAIGELAGGEHGRP